MIYAWLIASLSLGNGAPKHLHLDIGEIGAYASAPQLDTRNQFFRRCQVVHGAAADAKHLGDFIGGDHAGRRAQGACR